jgi:4-alpha-glucanotransferase
MDLRRVIQFFFYEQWHALRRYCAQRSIRVVGDIAIFVAYDSADVWAHCDLFRLRKDDLEPEAVSGVPPDAFSATGQRWGTPLYDWDAIRSEAAGGSTACAEARRLRLHPSRSLLWLRAVLGDSR